MEEQGHHARTWIVVALVIGLLGSCGISAVVGGAMGYLAGRKAAQSVAPRLAPWAAETEVPAFPEMPSPGPGAALIVSVAPGSPAERAGLQPGDMILGVGEDPIGLQEGESLEARLAQYAPGDSADLQILRNGRKITVSVVLGRNPQRSSQPWLGISYRWAPDVAEPGGPR
jgi:membrane-associated protease RseP (regulator of RpoE activity)